MEHLLSGERARGMKRSPLDTLIDFSPYNRPQTWCHSSVFSSPRSHIQSTSKSYQFDFRNRSGCRPMLNSSAATTLVQATTSISVIVIISLYRLQWYFQYSCQSDHSARKPAHVSPFQMLYCLSISLRVKYLRCPKAPTCTGPGLPVLVSFCTLPHWLQFSRGNCSWTCLLLPWRHGTRCLYYPGMLFLQPSSWLVRCLYFL